MTPAINDWPPSPLDSATHRQHQLNRKDDYKRSLPGGRRVSGGHWFHFHFVPSSSFRLLLSSHYSTHGAGRGRRHRDLWPAPSFRGWSSKKKKMEEINEGSEWTHEGLCGEKSFKPTDPSETLQRQQGVQITAQLCKNWKLNQSRNLFHRPVIHT